MVIPAGGMLHYTSTGPNTERVDSMQSGRCPGSSHTQWATFPASTGGAIPSHAHANVATNAVRLPPAALEPSPYHPSTALIFLAEPILAPTRVPDPNALLPSSPSPDLSTQHPLTPLPPCPEHMVGPVELSTHQQVISLNKDGTATTTRHLKDDTGSSGQ